MKDVTERVKHLIDKLSNQEGMNKDRPDPMCEAIATSPILAMGIDRLAVPE